jgi:hypothetical protein
MEWELASGTSQQMVWRLMKPDLLKEVNTETLLMPVLSMLCYMAHLDKLQIVEFIQRVANFISLFLQEIQVDGNYLFYKDI